MKTASALSLLAVLGAAAAKSPELIPDTFVENLQSKNMFIKFYAPWCGHCKQLAPAWDSLAEQYSSSSSVLIGSVDCTAVKAKELCEDYGVQGFPTLKYFKDGDKTGEDYNGGRGLDELAKFVEDNLNKKCVVGSEEAMKKTESNCSQKEIDYANKMRGKTDDERKTALERLDKMKGNSMKPELKSWIYQRMNILNGLESSGVGDEL